MESMSGERIDKVVSIWLKINLYWLNWKLSWNEDNLYLERGKNRMIICRRDVLMWKKSKDINSKNISIENKKDNEDCSFKQIFRVYFMVFIFWANRSMFISRHWLRWLVKYCTCSSSSHSCCCRHDILFWYLIN